MWTHPSIWCNVLLRYRASRIFRRLSLGLFKVPLSLVGSFVFAAKFFQLELSAFVLCLHIVLKRSNPWLISGYTIVVERNCPTSVLKIFTEHLFLFSLKQIQPYPFRVTFDNRYLSNPPYNYVSKLCPI